MSLLLVSLLFTFSLIYCLQGPRLGKDKSGGLMDDDSFAGKRGKGKNVYTYKLFVPFVFLSLVSGISLAIGKEKKRNGATTINDNG